MINKILEFIKVVVTILCLIFLVLGELTTFFTLLVTLFFLCVSLRLQKKIGYSDGIEILIFLFILMTEVLGQIFRFYVRVSYFDIIIHALSGFIVSGMSFYVLKKINRSYSSALIIVFSLMMSMGIAAVWELTEFGIDRVFHEDMQKDSIVKEITSYKFALDDKRPLVIKVDKVLLNDIDLTKEYGGYIDIGLYDTMGDMFSALIGSIVYILVYKKSGAI